MPERAASSPKLHHHTHLPQRCRASEPHASNLSCEYNSNTHTSGGARRGGAAGFAPASAEERKNFKERICPVPSVVYRKKTDKPREGSATKERKEFHNKRKKTETEAQRRDERGLHLEHLWSAVINLTSRAGGAEERTQRAG